MSAVRVRCKQASPRQREVACGACRRDCYKAKEQPLSQLRQDVFRFRSRNRRCSADEEKLRETLCVSYSSPLAQGSRKHAPALQGPASSTARIRYSTNRPSCVPASRRINAATPHPPGQARHLPPLGKAKNACDRTALSKAPPDGGAGARAPEGEITQGKNRPSRAVWSPAASVRNLSKPSPVGEGGPRQRWMRCHAQTDRRACLPPAARGVLLCLFCTLLSYMSGSPRLRRRCILQNREKTQKFPPKTACGGVKSSIM
mgnify:CR=1 FL=1